jgi:hypothetical protein
MAETVDGSLGKFASVALDHQGGQSYKQTERSAKNVDGGNINTDMGSCAKKCSHFLLTPEHFFGAL